MLAPSAIRILPVSEEEGWILLPVPMAAAKGLGLQLELLGLNVSQNASLERRYHTCERKGRLKIENLLSKNGAASPFLPLQAWVQI